jgi:hypothetical protein
MSKPSIAHLRDPKWYLEHLCQIKGKKPGLMPFVLNEAQKDLFNILRKENRVIVLKARQIGFSTAICGYLYHKTITTPGTNTALIGYNSELASEFLDRIKLFLQTTPAALRPQVHYNSKFEISFPKIKSKIFILSGENVGRGYTLHNALVSELALWEKPEEKMLAIEAAVPPGGQLIIESTPRGVGNLYHRMWFGEDNGYYKKEYGWWWVYNQAEIDGIRKRVNDPMKFAQEYELEFLTSGRSVFEPDVTKRMRDDILVVGDEVIDYEGHKRTVRMTDNGLRVYRDPFPGRNYIVGVDVAEGVTGGDFSTATILDRTSGEEVAFFRGHLPADKLAQRLNIWGRDYNDALMVVEINNHGLTTVTALRNLMYPTLYFRPSKFDTMGTSWTDRIGWKTSRVTRPLMIDDLADAMRSKLVTIHSKETLDEMLTFVYDGGNNMIAQHGFHDDCLFSLAIAYQGFKVMYSGRLEQVDERFIPQSDLY